jgi:peptidoglycan/xylan/chitin deacetylase (PgdA/CDA1 family)
MRVNKIFGLMSVLTPILLRTGGPRTGRSIYLTFDDGPHPVHTPALLELLERHGAKGCFFLTGNLAQKHPDVVRMILKGGHAIGNHSMHHPKMRTLSARDQWEEIGRADEVLERFDGVRRHAFRPPYGRVTIAMLLGALWRRRPVVLWTIDSLDYKLKELDIVRRMRELEVGDGDVILFHDDSASASLVLEQLLPEWSSQGYSFPRLATVEGSP